MIISMYKVYYVNTRSFIDLLNKFYPNKIKNGEQINILDIDSLLRSHL